MRTKKLFLILALLCAVAQGAWAQNGIYCTASDKNRVVCTDGTIYDNVAAATADGKTAAAKIIYIDEVNKKGLALALKDEARNTQDGGITACNNKNTSMPVVGGTWKLASKSEWDSMISAAGGSPTLHDGFSSVGGTNMDVNVYWSSERNGSNGLLLQYSRGWSDFVSNSQYANIRACLTFNLLTLYEIGSQSDWIVFCTAVNLGSTLIGDTFSDKYVKLTSDISVSEMAGSSESNSFQGLFDGDGHTLTVSYNTEYAVTAPFRYVKNATIKNLKTTGTITTGGMNAAGIVGEVAGSLNLSSCNSSVSISSSRPQMDAHGGLVASNNGNVTISGCVFDGSFAATVAHNNLYGTTFCGGIVGMCVENKSTTITNSLVAPSSVAEGMVSKTFVGLDDNATVTIENCYFVATANLPTNQGTKVNATAPANEISKSITISGTTVYFDACSVSGVESAYKYTGSVIQIVPTVTDDGQVLTEGTDYTYAINPSTVQEQGDYTLTINGMGDYTGTKTLAFSVTGLTFVNAETTTMTTGKYLVNKDVTINERITVSGDVVLDLGEGAKLSSKKGIEVSEGNRLTINGPGSLHIQGCDLEKSGIGAVEVGEIIINGGNVEVYGGFYGAAIGGDRNNTKGGRIIINGGVVKGFAVTAAAFGGGSTTKSDGIYGVCGDVVINGGQVDAGRYNLNAGVGPGYEMNEPYHNSGTLTLSWTNPNDYIMIGRVATLRKSTLNSITFADGKMFILEGTNTVATATNIANQTLVPAAVFFDKDDNSTMLSDCEGKPLSALLADRTLYKDGKWNTLCLPFNVKLADSPLEGATARPLTAASITGTTLNLTFGDAVDELVAGTPYLIKWTKAADYVDDDAHNIVNPVFKGATIDAADNSFDNGEGGDMRVRFLGTYKSTEFNAEDKSVLLMGGSNNLYYPNTGAGIGAQRAYFKIGDGDVLLTRGITNFNIDFGDGETATGIISIGQMDNLQSDNSKNAGAWYSIDGRKVANGPLSPRGRFTLEDKPTAKGLYINNGKKILIK